MCFTWDEEKKACNLAKHGVSFKRATLVFDDPRAISLLDDYDLEERWLTIGLVNGVVVVVVVHTVQEPHNENDEEVRIISARKATRRETEIYERGT